jgi:phage-related protein
MEIVADCDGQAFRATYVTMFDDAVYALHAFNKKSTKGKETPRRDIETIEARLKAVKGHHEKKLKG